MRCAEDGANIKTIFPEKKLLIRLNLTNDEAPLDGSLVVACESRYGERIEHHYVISGEGHNMQTRHFEIHEPPKMIQTRTMD